MPTRGLKNSVLMLNQLFGENDNDFYRQLGLLGHNGLDFYTKHFENGNAPIYAAHDGYVISDASQQSDSAGRFVKLMSDEVEIGGRKCKVMTVYFHLKEARVSSTDSVNREIYYLRKNERYVKAGSLIGIGNNTGQYTTGAHLHFGMYIYWKRTNGSYVPDLENGYGGAVDPMPYLQDGKVYQSQRSWITSWWYRNGQRITKAEAYKYITPPPWF